MFKELLGGLYTVEKIPIFMLIISIPMDSNGIIISEKFIEFFIHIAVLHLFAMEKTFFSLDDVV